MEKDKNLKQNLDKSDEILHISDVSNCFNDEVEIRALYKIPSLLNYEKWTRVSKFLAYGLQGIEIRELK